MQTASDLKTSYDLVAKEYADKFYDELDSKPFDRKLLERFAQMVKPLGRACDMGCGCGHIARFLHMHGLDVLGVDISQGMIEQAGRLNPGIEFKHGDMLSLPFENEQWGGIAAFYSIIHIGRAEVVKSLKEMKRVLKPGGILLLAFHIGSEVIHLDEWWDKKVSLDFTFFTTGEMTSYLNKAGYEILEATEREPYKDVEYQSHRSYIFARKPNA